MCVSDPTAGRPGGHLHKAITSLYSRFKSISLLGEDKFEMVESKIVALPYWGKATSVIDAVDEKLESAYSAAVTLKRSAKHLVKRCRECRDKVSKEELQRLVEAVAVCGYMYVSENRTFRGGADRIRNVVALLNSLPRSVAKVKLSSFEYLEASTPLARLPGSRSLAISEVALDKLFLAMFGCRPTKQIFLHMCDGSTRLVAGLSRTQTVRGLKVHITAKEGIPISEQCLLYNGKELRDRERLADESKVCDSSSVHVMLRVAGGMKIKVKTSPTDEFFEIDVNPADTVESMMKQLQQSWKSLENGSCQLELCLPEQLSAVEMISRLATMINQRSNQLLETARAWYAATCTVSDRNFGNFSGLDSCLQHYTAIAAALEDISVSLDRTEDLTADTVKVCWSLSAVLAKPLLGITPTGGRFKVSGISTHRVVNGWIHSSDWSWEAAGMMAPGMLNAARVPEAPVVDPLQPSQFFHDSDYTGSGSESNSGNGSPHTVPLTQMEQSLDAPMDSEWFLSTDASVDLDIMSLLESDTLDFQLPPSCDIQVKEELDICAQPSHSVARPETAIPNRELAVWNDEPKTGIKRDAPVHGDVVCLQYLEYECGYCKVRKVSTSTGGDGRVRIRCECGGKHQDGQPRMHAKWKLKGETQTGKRAKVADFVAIGY